MQKISFFFVIHDVKLVLNISFLYGFIYRAYSEIEFDILKFLINA